MNILKSVAVGWQRAPLALRAVLVGLVVGMTAANVWPVLLLTLGVPGATLGEAGFLVAYLWWVGGGGAPRSTQPARRDAFRRRRLTTAGWAWGLLGGLAMAASVHAAIVVLFRLVPFPAAAFHQGYDFSFIPTPALRWVAVVVSAISAGVCEETGFRGYMQRPLESRYGAVVAILISAAFFTLLHLNKGWATIGMTPIVFGAGLLLGALAWASGSLIPGMVGHAVMDVGLFAYWWTGIAGTFSARPISETGIDPALVIAALVLAVALSTCLVSLWRLRALGNRP